MMKKGEVYTGTVERVEFPNKGIVRVDGKEKAGNREECYTGAEGELFHM